MSMNEIVALVAPTILVGFFALLILFLFKRKRKPAPQTHAPHKPQVAYGTEILARAKGDSKLDPTVTIRIDRKPGEL